MFFKQVVTLGPLGYALAPGTVATVATIPLVVVMMQHQVSGMWWIVISLMAACVAYCCITMALPFFAGRSDPRAIVLDEVVGTVITFTGVPISLPAVALGFLLFRLFDIKKPHFIRWAEKLPGAGGILFDDILAGLAANVVLRFVMSLS